MLKGGASHRTSKRSFAIFRAIFRIDSTTGTRTSPNTAASVRMGAPDLVEEDGMILPDGNAWGESTPDNHGEPVGFTFASVAPKDSQRVRRTISCTYEKGVTEVSDTPLN